MPNFLGFFFCPRIIIHPSPDPRARKTLIMIYKIMIYKIIKIIIYSPEQANAINYKLEATVSHVSTTAVAGGRGLSPQLTIIRRVRGRLKCCRRRV